MRPLERLKAKTLSAARGRKCADEDEDDRATCRQRRDEREKRAHAITIGFVSKTLSTEARQ